MRIKNLTEGKTLASLGNETIKVKIELENGTSEELIVPAGISTGKYEARIVTADEAISQIRKIKNIILNKRWTQEELDKRLDELGLGGNASLALSGAFWKAQSKVSKHQNLKFPRLMLLLFEGGKHGNPNISMQEFMIIEDSLREAILDFKMLRAYLEKNNLQSTVGAEGGFSPVGFDNIIALDTIKKVFPKKEIAVDAAANFGEGQVVNFDMLVSNYNIKSIEDPFPDEDWEEWISFCSRFSEKIMIVGDDLTATNPKRLQKAIDFKAINAAVIKPNQNGTISGTLEAVRIAKKAKLKIIVSHRGEETIDDWIVDFALWVDADFVKFGGMDRGERVAKYNRLSYLGMQ